MVSPWLTKMMFADEMHRAGVSLHILEKADRRYLGQDAPARPSSDSVGRAVGARAIYGRWSETARLFVEYSLLYKIRLRRLLATIKPDLLHGWYLTNVGLVAALSGFRPLIISPWGSDVVFDADTTSISPLARFARRYSLLKADMITATSEFLAGEAAKYAPRGREIHVVPFGVECERFRPVVERMTVVTAGEIVVGFAKPLRRKYGPEYLIMAFRILCDKYPNARLRIAGEGEMAGELEKMVRASGLCERVTFTGYVPHDRMPAFLEGVDIFVMPSSFTSETFGVAAVEASAMEIPVVATRVGGVPEVVVDGVTGLLVKQADERALAEALSTLAENPELRKQMGRAGRAHVLSRYKWEDNAAEMSRLYEHLLDGWARERL